MEAQGFSLCEIVKDLSKKYRKTERTLYYDASTRKTWQPLYTHLFELDKARLVVINRYEYIYKEASAKYLFGNETQQPVYMKIMLDVTNNLIDLLGIKNDQKHCKNMINETELITKTARLKELLNIENC